MLKNGQYNYGPWAEHAGQFRLINSRTTTRKDEGASEWVELDVNHIAFGDFNNDGQKDAAVIIIYAFDALDAGGNSSFEMRLSVVTNRGNNLIIFADQQYVGNAKFDKVLFVAAENGIISVETENFTYGNRTLRLYKVRGNELIEI